MAYILQGYTIHTLLVRRASTQQQWSKHKIVRVYDSLRQSMCRTQVFLIFYFLLFFVNLMPRTDTYDTDIARVEKKMLYILEIL